jgi:hypothetical protein
MHSRSSVNWLNLAALLCALAVCFFFATSAQAQTTPAEIALNSQLSTLNSAAPAPAPLTWVQAVIAIITPVIIAGVKLLVPRIPRLWLPILAPLVGLLVDVAAHFAAGTALNPTLALALGAAGVGLREAVDQLKQAAAGTSGTPVS